MFSSFLASYVLLIIIWYIFEAVMLIAIAVKLAELKGRSGFTWGILTFLFSIIPVFILALLPDLNYNYYQGGYSQYIQYIPQICSDNNRLSSNANSSYIQVVRSQKTRSGWRCGNCGAENPDHFTECSACFNPKRL